MKTYNSFKIVILLGLLCVVAFGTPILYDEAGGDLALSSPIVPFVVKGTFNCSGGPYEGGVYIQTPIDDVEFETAGEIPV